MVSPQEQGVEAAKKAVEIIEGKKAGDLPFVIPTSKYYFDYEILKKYNLDNFEIPFLSNIVNKPKSFFEENRRFIDSAFLLMPLLILLIIGLIVNISKRIRLEIKLVEQNKLDNVLLNNIKSAVYWKSNQDILLGCNDALCKLLDMKKEDIIGARIDIIMPELYEKLKNEDGFIDELETQLSFKNRSLDV